MKPRRHIYSLVRGPVNGVPLRTYRDPLPDRIERFLERHRAWIDGGILVLFGALVGLLVGQWLTS